MCLPGAGAAGRRCLSVELGKWRSREQWWIHESEACWNLLIHPFVVSDAMGTDRWKSRLEFPIGRSTRRITKQLSLFFLLRFVSTSIFKWCVNLRAAAPVQTFVIALLLVFVMGAAASAAEYQINESAGQMKEPRIATASDGSFVVVWKNGDSDEIWARLFDASDDPVGNDFQISTGVGVYQKPNVSIAADGSFVVVWQKENSEFDFSIYARRFDASGSPLDGQFLVNT